MTSQPKNPKDLQQRLREIEAELNRSSESASAEPIRASVSNPSSVGDKEVSLVAIASSVVGWFNGLGSTGKIIAGVVGAFAALTLLRITVTLVSTVVSLLALGLIGYAAYRIWIAPQTDDISKG